MGKHEGSTIATADLDKLLARIDGLLEANALAIAQLDMRIAKLSAQIAATADLLSPPRKPQASTPMARLRLECPGGHGMQPGSDVCQECARIARSPKTVPEPDAA